MTETLTPYEEIAGTRPRMRRDVLYTRTPSGVLFHNAQGGFNVSSKEAYRFATVLVPHLNGERRVEDLCQGLGERQRDMVVRLVHALYARGFARDVPPGSDAAVLPEPVAERFAEQIGYLDHYADAPAERFGRFRDTRVAVLGDDPLARWAALSLLRNGCATVGVTADVTGAQEWREVREEADALASAGCPVALERAGGDGGQDGAAPPDWSALEGYDVVVATGQDAGLRHLVRLLEQGVPRGRTLLPAWQFGRKLVVGPSMTADGTGCWSCAALRLGANGAAADAAQLWSGLSPAGPLDGGAAPVTGPLAAMAGNLLGYEVFRQRTGALPAETERQLIVQDLDSLDVAAEPLLPHPRCRYCGPAPATADGTEPAPDLLAVDLDAADTPAGPDALPADGAADEQAARDALAELDRRAPLVQEQAGVFGAFADEDWEQTPLKISTVRLGIAPGRHREVAACDVHHVAGARLRALFAAAEVYAEHVVPAAVLDGPALEKARATWPLVAPAALAISSGLAARPDAVARWAAATSLLDGRTHLVPAAALRPFGPENATGVFERTGAGMSAGATRDAAAAGALASALAYDALRRAVRHETPVTSLELQRLADDPELLFLTRSAGHLGVTVELLDLGSDPLAVVLARAVDPRTGAWRWAVAGSPRRRQAVLEALRDLLGAVQRAAQVADGSDGVHGGAGDPLWAGLDVGTLAAAGDCGAALDAAVTWHTALDALRAAGRDALVADADAADLRSGGVHVTRVLLVDGMRHGD